MAILIIGGRVRRNQAILHDHDALRKWLPELCQLIEMHPVGDVLIQGYPHWDGGAPSAILFLEDTEDTAIQFLKESAIIVHTYPEREYIEIVLHSCKAIPGEDDDGGPVTDAMIDTLALDVKARHYLGKFNWRSLSQT